MGAKPELELELAGLGCSDWEEEKTNSVTHTSLHSCYSILRGQEESTRGNTVTLHQEIQKSTRIKHKTVVRPIGVNNPGDVIRVFLSWEMRDRWERDAIHLHYGNCRLHFFFMWRSHSFHDVVISASFWSVYFSRLSGQHLVQTCSSSSLSWSRSVWQKLYSLYLMYNDGSLANSAGLLMLHVKRKMFPSCLSCCVSQRRKQRKKEKIRFFGHQPAQVDTDSDSVWKELPVCFLWRAFENKKKKEDYRLLSASWTLTQDFEVSWSAAH